MVSLMIGDERKPGSSGITEVFRRNEVSGGAMRVLGAAAVLFFSCGGKSRTELLLLLTVFLLTAVADVVNWTMAHSRAVSSSECFLWGKSRFSSLLHTNPALR